MPKKNTLKWTMWVTPKGEAMYPHLAKPDTKFDPDGKFRVKLKFTDEEAKQTLVEFVEKAMEFSRKNALKETAKKPMKQKSLIPMMPYDEDEQGNLLMGVDTKAKITFSDGNVKYNKVRVFDAQTNEISPDEVTSGSIIRVQMVWRPYYMPASNTYGISKRLKFVQLIEKKAGGFEEVAFDAIDGGYVDTTPKVDFNKAPEIDFEGSSEDMEGDF